MESSPYQPISTVADRLKQRWEDYRSGKNIPLIHCGMPCLVSNKLFPRNKLSVLHGISGSGKSTFAFQVALGTAIELFANDLPGGVAVNSLEMSDEDLVERMAAILSGVDVSAWMNNTLSEIDYQKLLTWVDFVSVLPLYIDDTSFLTTTLMDTNIVKLHDTKGPIILLITDYGELFSDEDNSEEQRLNHIFRQQFRLARKIGCAVLAISQSTNNRNETGRTFIAGPDGTRYSKGILQATDLLVELWNPVQLSDSGRILDIKDRNLSLEHPYLMIQKYRGGPVGECIPVGWIPERTTFFDMSISQNKGNETVFINLEKALNKYNGW